MCCELQFVILCALSCGLAGDFHSDAERADHMPLVARRAVKSIYLAFSRFVDVGGHVPASPTGRLFMLFWGFTVLIFISCYTVSACAMDTGTPGWCTHIPCWQHGR